MLCAAFGGVLFLFSGALRYAFRSHPKPKSVESALNQFRSTTSTSTFPRNFRQPVPGVYVVTGQGREHISFPPNSQTDGPIMPVTVQPLDAGCWRWHIDYNTAHWQEYDFCPRGSQLILVGDRNAQSWDFGTMHIANRAEFTCDPPAPIVVDDPRPGSSYPNTCTGQNTAVSGKTTVTGPAEIVGSEQLTIGGTSVPAVHERRHQTMSGGQQGTLDEEWWFAADTGMPLRVQRTYSLRSASPIGTIGYTESGSWLLNSLVPRR